MKRDKNLYTLSHEHHQGLIFGLRLKKGIEKDIDPEILSRFTLDFWSISLQSHFEDEERLLTEHIKDEALKSEFLNDHDEIRNHVKSVESGIEVIPSLIQLSTRVEKHIRFEERKLFPYLENILDNETLQSIGASLEHEVVCQVFKPEFWKQKG